MRWFIPAFALFYFGCFSSSETMKEKLELVGQADLQIILQDLPKQAKYNLLSKPTFVVDEYMEFQGDTAIVFQAYAKLVFFYLDPSVGLCQMRKYRYKRSERRWDRWEVELKHIPEKYLDSYGSLPQP